MLNLKCLLLFLLLSWVSISLQRSFGTFAVIQFKISKTQNLLSGILSVTLDTCCLSNSGPDCYLLGGWSKVRWIPLCLRAKTYSRYSFTNIYDIYDIYTCPLKGKIWLVTRKIKIRCIFFNLTIFTLLGVYETDNKMIKFSLSRWKVYLFIFF